MSHGLKDGKDVHKVWQFLITQLQRTCLNDIQENANSNVLAKAGNLDPRHKQHFKYLKYVYKVMAMQ